MTPILTRSTLIAAVAAFAFPALAADKSNPDWPCIQRKVENLAYSQMWDGPALEEATKTWQDNEKVAAVVRQLVTRKISIEDAVGTVEKFATELPEGERDSTLTSLFAGIFETLSTERRVIMSGIEKYTKRQRERAKVIEDKGKVIADLEAKAGSDEKAQEELARLQEDYDWEQRVFKERNDNIPIACELPVLIDQRLFELAKAVRGKMKS